MNQLNSLILEGNLVKDAVLTEPAPGFKKCVFTMGVNRFYKNKNNEAVNEASFFDVEAYNNLTEDVNSLIRDYTRRVVKSLSASSFTRERVENLAKTLVNTPNMQKIKEDKALTEYVILYMLRLVSNFQ